MDASNSKPDNSSCPTGPLPQPPHTTCIHPQRALTPSWAWGSSSQKGSTRCTPGKVTSRPTPHGTILTPTHPAHFALKPHRPSPILSCPVPWPLIRDLTSSKGSLTWPPRPLSGPTGSCSLPWLSSFALPPLASPWGCLRSPHLSTPPSLNPLFHSTAPPTPSPRG